MGVNALVTNGKDTPYYIVGIHHELYDYRWDEGTTMEDCVDYYASRESYSQVVAQVEKYMKTDLGEPLRKLTSISNEVSRRNEQVEKAKESLYKLRPKAGMKEEKQRVRNSLKKLESDRREYVNAHRDTGTVLLKGIPDDLSAVDAGDFDPARIERYLVNKHIEDTWLPIEDIATIIDD